MKKMLTILIVGLLTSRIIWAQGITYLSNLNQTSTGSNPVGSNSWLAEDFSTGTNASGYTLNSIQLAMADATGNPSGFAVMIYAAGGVGGIAPITSLGTLDGSENPSTAGTYIFNPASILTLLPSTIYFIVLTASTTVANGAYEWSYANTSSYNGKDGWWGGLTFLSNDGSSWFRLGSNPNYDYSGISITASAVPEPSSLILFGLSSLIFIFRRK